MGLDSNLQIDLAFVFGFEYKNIYYDNKMFKQTYSVQCM